MVQSTMCIYYCLQILIGVCCDYLFPTDKETEAYREWKTGGSRTGIRDTAEVQTQVS